MISPLIYPGGKAPLAPVIGEIMRDSGINNPVFCEPFCGGASLSLTLLAAGAIERARINDLDYGVYCFWESVMHNSLQLCAAISDLELTRECWEEQKRIYDSQTDFTGGPVDMAAAVFFLSRTNWGGLLRAYGPRVPIRWRSDVEPSRERILEISRKYAGRIEVTNKKYEDFLAEEKGGLFFIDPPYVSFGKRFYKFYFAEKEHKKLARRLKKLRGVCWIVTYDDERLIRDLYLSYAKMKFRARADKKTELLILGNGCSSALC